MEKILKIHNTDEYPHPEYLEHKLDGKPYIFMIGVIIETDKQKIFIGIDNNQNCCEHYGFISSEDDYSDFIGSELHEIKQVDTLLNVNSVKLLDNDVSNKYAETIFINVETSNGTLQFVMYNVHNGYYGHDVIVISDKFKLEKSI